MTDIVNVTKKTRSPLEGNWFDGIAPGLEYRTIQDCLHCEFGSCDGCPKQKIRKDRKPPRMEVCRRCGGIGKVIQLDEKNFVVECWGCGSETRSYAYRATAIRAWNKGLIQ